ncbi:hypothetical protein BGX27_008249 [Mortierella sp. AM989]|nr:hypothetical protein BGX27_008249 [Mortierella sp. AM989]
MSTTVFPHETTHRSSKDNDRRQGRHLDEAQELDLGDEPSALQRLFVLLAIIIFLRVGSSSIPNFLAARHPSEQHSRVSEGKFEAVSSAGDSLRLEQVQTHYLHFPDSLVCVNDNPISLMQGRDESEKFIAHGSLKDPRGSKSSRDKDNNIVANEPMSREQHSNPDKAAIVEGIWVTSSGQSPPPPSSTIDLNLTPLSDQGHERDQWKAPMVEGAKAWPLIQACARLSFRVGLWIIRRFYLITALVIVKPIGVVVAFAETPYVITRDICRAFLPVYSFFTFAAVIGVAVGGFALWIARLLIAAVGADQEVNDQFATQSMAVPHAKLTKSNRAFGRRNNSSTILKSSPMDASLGLEKGINHFRSKPNLGASLGANFHRRRSIISEGEDDDDGEDDDEDDDDD